MAVVRTQPAVASPTNVVDSLGLSGAQAPAGLQGTRLVLGDAACRTADGFRKAKSRTGMKAGGEEENKEQARYRAAQLVYVAEMDIDLAVPTVMLLHLARLAEDHSAAILRDSRVCEPASFAGSSTGRDHLPVDDLQRISPESRLVRTLLARQTSIPNVDALLAILAQGSEAPLVQVMMANRASLADPPRWREPRNSWPCFETTKLRSVGTKSSWLGRVWAKMRVGR